ncbi:MAG: hypothetical protein PUD15_04535 [Prevotella sp.]|uniref:OmpP1/FadL family transporter n=1 Tax=Prevotella sp. AGR2160 TaxID=1280674 RepID=UPI0003FE4CDF|nr:membrane protein [Prevotella sp. AGR2160]MDD5861813.1 hypothetical protein [Prevotella sp.]
MRLHNLLAAAVIALSAPLPALAGGILTNTNQNVAFNRELSRDASIGIDGIYSNPAGVAFLGKGLHLSLNWQTVFQKRKIDNQYALFANNQNNASTARHFEGHATAPVLPTVQAAYNWKNFSFQAMVGLTGGGGKCTFDDGLGSFEKIVSETAVATSQLAAAIDRLTAAQYGVNPGLSADTKFGKTGSYSYTSFMRGRNYYYSASLGVAYRFTPDLSGFAGVRGVYAKTNYYGYVRNIKVGQVPLYTMLDATKTNSADIELNCDQSGFGFTPILGVDYRLGRWNFAAKYEFKTRVRLKNEAVNQAPSIGNLPNTLIAAGIPQSVIASSAISGALSNIKTQFDTKMEAATGEYADGKKIAGDIPALLTLGVQYSPVDAFRLNAGFHYFFDKQATSYNHREDKLSRGTIEWNAGAEYDASKVVTVSAGWQRTSYGLAPEYMDDKSFVVSSNSIGAGLQIHVSKKVRVNLAYFCTIYEKYKTNETDATTHLEYDASYTRNNNVLGAGVDIDF